MHTKLGEGERKVRLGQDSLPNIHFTSGNERKVGTLFSRSLAFVSSVVMLTVAMLLVVAPITMHKNDAGMILNIFSHSHCEMLNY